MSERFVTTSPDGSRDTLYERRTAMSRDLLGDSQDDKREGRIRRRGPSSTPTKESGAKRTKIRVPELALGLLLVVGGALAASALAGKRTETIQVVAAARDVDRGRPFSAEDLVALEVESRFAHSMMSTQDASSLLGRVSTVDVPEGTPILPTMIQSMAPLGDGEEVVSLRVEVGDVPPSVGVGDRVRVVLVPDPSLSVDTAVTEFDVPAVVWDVVAPSEESTDFVVSLVVPREFLAKSAMSGRSKIALVAEGSEAKQ